LRITHALFSGLGGIKLQSSARQTDDDSPKAKAATMAVAPVSSAAKDFHGQEHAPEGE
jgi:hypothetical protein